MLDSHFSDCNIDNRLVESCKRIIDNQKKKLCSIPNTSTDLYTVFATIRRQLQLHEDN